MRALTHVCLTLAVCWVCAFGWVAAGSAQVPAMSDAVLVPTDVAPFQFRLNLLAEEYGVKAIATGHVFGSFDRETFLFRLGDGSNCAKQKTCVFVLFRDAQDNFPFVTYCDAGRFETAHAHRAGMQLYRFEFVCEKTKFQIQLSPRSAFVGSYIELDD